MTATGDQRGRHGFGDWIEVKVRMGLRSAGSVRCSIVFVCGK